MSSGHILLVDDDIHTQKVLGNLLKHYHIAVEVAGNGNQALAMLQDDSFSVVIIDLSLPGMSGWQLLKAIQTNPATTDLPCLALTAYYSPSVVRQALEAGFLEFFSKPLDLVHFVDALEPYLS